MGIIDVVIISGIVILLSTRLAYVLGYRKGMDDTAEKLIDHMEEVFDIPEELKAVRKERKK